MLPPRQQRDRCEDRASEIKFGHQAGPAREPQRSAHIECETGAQLILVLELLHAESVGAAIEPPIEPAEFVAVLVSPILGELRRGTFDWTAMATRQKTFHEILRA